MTKTKICDTTAQQLPDV